MLKLRGRRIAVVLAGALLLALAPFSALGAQEAESTAEEEVTLTGQLSTDDLMGNYVLVERESGDSIALRGPAELADHVGALVKVTGKWGTDGEGNRYFTVSKIERV